MSDVDTDWGDQAHIEPRSYDNGSRAWVDCLQDVLDEVTADLRAANPDRNPFEMGGVVLDGKIEGNVRPLVACTWLELTQVQAHTWLGSNLQGKTHDAAWKDALDLATRSARHANYPQVVHKHRHGEPCNRGCRLVRPASQHD